MNNEISNKSNTGKIIGLFALSFALCLSAYIAGSMLGTYSLNIAGILVATISDFILYSFVFMIYPIIMRIKQKGKLPEEYDKKFQVSGQIGAVILAVIYYFVSSVTFANAFGFFIKMLIFSLIYLCINKWLFIKDA